jgi:hypothetical protein
MKRDAAIARSKQAAFRRVTESIRTHPDNYDPKFKTILYDLSAPSSVPTEPSDGTGFAQFGSQVITS